jgi:putative transposase
MGQSLTKIATHITFSTKNRLTQIDDAIKDELNTYIAGICKELDCPPVKVGGYTDHIHILCLLSKKLALMDLLEEVKKRSSKWIKTKGAQYKDFYWQLGYGAFSVNPSDIGKVVDYIANQHVHHQKMTFQQEFRRFLMKYGIEFDERYVWD